MYLTLRNVGKFKRKYRNYIEGAKISGNKIHVSIIYGTRDLYVESNWAGSVSPSALGMEDFLYKTPDYSFEKRNEDGHTLGFWIKSDDILEDIMNPDVLKRLVTEGANNKSYSHLLSSNE